MRGRYRLAGDLRPPVDEHMRVGGVEGAAVGKRDLQCGPCGGIEGHGSGPSHKSDGMGGVIDVGNGEMAQIVDRRGVKEREQADKGFVGAEVGFGRPAPEQPALGGKVDDRSGEPAL